MTEAELKAYIEQAKAHGLTPQQMREALVGAGWNAATVDAALGLTTLPVLTPASSAASIVPATTDASTTVVFASVWRRIFAALLDGFLAGLPLLGVMLAYGAMSFAVGAASGGSAGATTAVSIVLGVAGVAAVAWILVYRPYLEGKRGATWGMRMLGLRVVREDELSRVGIGFWLSLGRAIVFSLAGNITMQISSAWMLMDPRRRHAADLICKTVVLYDPKNAFAFSSLEAIPVRAKRTVWFAILALIGAMSLVGSVGGAFSGRT